MDEYRTPEWSCREVLQLIKEYGERPALWDTDCEDYKNRFRKHQNWTELAAIFKCSKLEVERKMKILNSQYRRERLKAVRMRKLGNTHRITWYGYKAFAFMNKHWVRYRNRVNLMMSGDVKQESEDQDVFGSSADLMPFLEEDEDDGYQPCSLDDADVPSYADEKDASEEKVDREENLESQPKESGAKILFDSKDEWALFGELVAHAFRKLPDNRIRCITKHKINTILYEAELAIYEKNDIK